jgi:EAL domain-containing protein (putative c-di-GMP-specific phosphodiesterase class I)
MAQRLNMKVVAEGIETEDQLLTLSQLGCDRGQGYLLGKPVNTIEFQTHWSKT